MRKYFLLFAFSFCVYLPHAFAQNAASGQQAQSVTVSNSSVESGSTSTAISAGAERGQSSTVTTDAATVVNTSESNTAAPATAERGQPAVVDPNRKTGSDPHQ